MKSEHLPADEQAPRSAEVVADIVREYESRPGRPDGHIVCRLVAESEPETFAAIAGATGLTESELWQHIEATERIASNPRLGERRGPPASIRNERNSLPDDDN